MPTSGTSFGVALPAGITAAKILSFNVLVTDINGGRIPQGMDKDEVSRYFFALIDPVDGLWLYTGSFATLITGRPFTCLITYME